MPTVLDAMVVASAYDTSGNGGRKLCITKNGHQFAILKTSTGFYVYKTTDNWTTRTLIDSYNGYNNLQDVCLATNGDKVYVLRTVSNIYVQYAIYNNDGSLLTSNNIVNNETALGGASLIANEQGTELHATWSSKNSSYPNSFNIRYAKGTINADGTVTWGAVEQVTTHNTGGGNIQNPSITLQNNIPIIAVEMSGMYFSGTTSANDSTNSGIYLFRKDSTLGTNTKLLSAWTYKSIHAVGSAYIQSSPSAIFVPQSVNGLANGRIWVAWHGRDSSTYDGIYTSYSDDIGVTWSTPVRITGSGNVTRQFPSITANSKNEVYILYNDGDSVSQVKCIKHANNAFGTPYNLTNRAAGNLSLYPSALFDLSVDFTEPLFIYKDTAKVGFYGTWTTTEISVAQGDLGEKTSKDNLLTYAITTDDTMSTITEKVNGVVIATKTATSGQNLSVGLTQAQWDAVRFGKYTDATGSKNTLTIEMGAEKWTYTFDKRLATDADVLSVVKAVKDSNEVQLPTIKKMLVDKVGGSNGDTFEEIIKSGEYGKKWASGTATGPNSPFITGLEFTPSIVYWWKDSEFGIYNSQTDRLVVYGKPTTNGYASMNMEAWPNNPSYIINSGGNFYILDSYVTNKNRANLNWLALE